MLLAAPALVWLQMTFPLYSPLLGPIKILNKRHVSKRGKRLRRAKLYYLRDLPEDKFEVF